MAGRRAVIKRPAYKRKVSVDRAESPTPCENSRIECSANMLARFSGLSKFLIGGRYQIR